MTFVAVFGFTPFTLANAAIGMLGYFRLFEAALNLLPISPLDGAKAWYVFPRLFKRAERKPEPRPGAWGSGAAVEGSVVGDRVKAGAALPRSASEFM